VKVVVAGGSGFLGTALTERLAARGDEVVVLSRRPSGADAARGGARQIHWRGDGTAVSSWVAEINEADAVVNLAGAGIADRRWSPARKQVLRDSRVIPTRSLVEGLRTATRRPAVFLQGSAVGYYGSTLDDRPFTESDPAGNDFLGRLCAEWELAAQPVSTLGVRLVVVRTGLVLARKGGVLEPMKLPFKLFVGGPVASGRQYFSWIHIDDWTTLVLWALDTPSVSGPINATSPNAVTNAEFSKALGRALGRPSWLPVPGFALKTLFGEFAEEGLIGGQRVVPRRARELGFSFRHPEAGEALSAVFGVPGTSER